MKQLIDQTAHFLTGMLIVYLCTLNTIYFSFMAGALIGVVRELTEESDKVTLSSLKNVMTSVNSLLDILFWGLGGLMVYILSNNLIF